MGGRKRRAPEPPKAVIESVLPESPADDAGFTPGCIITSVDGQPVRDMIDWRWLTADDVITLGYIDTDGASSSAATPASSASCASCPTTCARR